MSLTCIVQANGCRSQWKDLKTVKGYLNRLKNISGLQHFIILNSANRPLAISNTNQSSKTGENYYYDYRINKFRPVSELVNHDLTKLYNLPLK